MKGQFWKFAVVLHCERVACLSKSRKRKLLGLVCCNEEAFCIFVFLFLIGGRKS